MPVLKNGSKFLTLILTLWFFLAPMQLFANAPTFTFYALDAKPAGSSAIESLPGHREAKNPLDLLLRLQ